ncbi:MAG: hypothetical protein RL492_453 [Verrucomicrobiota bacterium]|jgi:hypothetical protein
MKRLLLTWTALLVGCAIPKNDPSFVAEKSPAAAALAGEAPKEGTLEERLKATNEKNDQRRRDGDWRAVQPAVGPKP